MEFDRIKRSDLRMPHRNERQAATTWNFSLIVLRRPDRLMRKQRIADCNSGNSLSPHRLSAFSPQSSLSSILLDFFFCAGLLCSFLCCCFFFLLSQWQRFNELFLHCLAKPNLFTSHLGGPIFQKHRCNCRCVCPITGCSALRNSALVSLFVWQLFRRHARRYRRGN